MLERASKLNKDYGGGSLTALPIIETQADDISAYIPTNVISITDGQIYLSSKLFYSGVRPAIDAGLSVSRVGGNAQIKSMKKVTGQLRLDLAQYKELEAFAKFGSDLDKATQAQLRRGERLIEILKQKQYNPLPLPKQIFIIFMANHGYLDPINKNKVQEVEEELFQVLDEKYEDLMNKIVDNEIDDKIEKKMESICQEVATKFVDKEELEEVEKKQQEKQSDTKEKTAKQDKQKNNSNN